MKKGSLFIVLCLCIVKLIGQPSSIKTITTSWGNYVTTNISGYGNTQLQVTIDGQNSLWHGVFIINGTNSWTPDNTWNNVTLLSWGGYNAGKDDVQALIMSNVPTNSFGGTTIVLKSNQPAVGAATITVVATGESTSSLALSSISTQPYAYTMASSQGTLNINTVNNNVGIGTSSPRSTLDLNNTGTVYLKEIHFVSDDVGWGADNSDPYTLRKVHDSPNNSHLDLNLNDDSNEEFRIYGNSCAGYACSTYSGNLYHYFRADGSAYHSGSLGIGTTNPGPYKLAVEGTIGARKIKVTQVNPWADFVFNDDYKLKPLTEVEQYIKTHKHLPDMPSAKEVEKNGIDVGDNQALLLKKIEELTLYVIEMKKDMDTANSKIVELEKKIKNKK